MSTTVVPDENTPIPEGSIMLRNFSVIGGMWDYQLNELVDLSPNCNTVNRYILIKALYSLGDHLYKFL